MVVFEGGRPRDQGQIMNWDPVLVLQPVHDIPVCNAPCHAEPSAHYYRTSATFFSSPIQLQSTPGAPFPLTSPIPPVRRWLVVHHPLISLHTTTTTHRSEQAPCDFEQPTPLPTPDPLDIHFQSFPTDTPPQSDECCQILGLGIPWVSWSSHR